MTTEQQARLGEITVWVGTAQELLQQAHTAAYAPGMDGVLSWAAKAAIGNANIRATDAAHELLPLVQKGECVSEDMTYEPVMDWRRRATELADTLNRRNMDVARLTARVGELKQENTELRMVLDYIDGFAGPADRTCHQWGIKLSEAARRDLADMGKLEYTYEVQP